MQIKHLKHGLKERLLNGKVKGKILNHYLKNSILMATELSGENYKYFFKIHFCIIFKILNLK